MNTTLNKIAAVLAFIIGAMAAFAGGQVLLGKVPDYYVINWLPVYNYTVGILTVLSLLPSSGAGTSLPYPLRRPRLGSTHWSCSSCKLPTAMWWQLTALWR